MIYSANLVEPVSAPQIMAYASSSENRKISASNTYTSKPLSLVVSLGGRVQFKNIRTLVIPRITIMLNPKTQRDW